MENNQVYISQMAQIFLVGLNLLKKKKILLQALISILSD